MFRRVSALTVVVFCSLLSVPGFLRADDAGVDQPLPRDPNNVYGQFDNGFRYIVRKNANPPGKVALYLEVRSGALNETDNQNGLAHFLEHMAFKGSAHSKPEQLIPFLNHMGMMFGADTNAHTNLWETCFKLTMPDTKPKTIDTAMTIFSDYASALFLSKVQIESERRVILEELRARKNVSQRLYKEMTQQLFAGTRLAVHDISGNEDQIKTFPRSEFVDYWNTWYRPENMTLVVVGDIDPAAVIAAMKEKLSQFTARAPARPALKAGLKPFESPRALVLTDPEQTAGEVDLIYMGPGRPPVTTTLQFRREVIEDVCSWIVNRRFTNLIARGNAPFREASIGDDDYVHEGYVHAASAVGQPQDWNKMLDSLIAEVSRAIDYGFTPEELDLARRGLLADAEWAVKTESSRDSTDLVAGIASSVGLDRPIISAQQRLTLLHDTLDHLRVDELYPIFLQDYRTKNYAYVLKLPPSADGLTIPNQQDVLAAANAAWARKQTAPEQVAQSGGILAAEPTPGQVASQETDADLGITTVTFANGVVLHHKFTDYKKDEVVVQITLPGGILEETPENRGITAAASEIFSRPATGRLSSTQIEDLLTGKDVDFGGSIGLDTMAIHVTASPTDLAAGLELSHALLTDPKLEPSALDAWKKREIQNLLAKPMHAEAQLSEAMAQTIYGGDFRMLPFTEEIINRQQTGTAEAWFKRIAGNAAIEVAVVGDLKLNDATALIAKYLGSLPTRTGTFRDLDKLRTVARKPGPYAKTVQFKSVNAKAIVIAGFLSCDERDQLRRPLTVACRILSDEMVQRIRFQEQLVYSIGCQNTPARSIPGTGMMISSAPTDPKNAAKLADTINEMIKAFAANGPTDDEVATAKKQMANALASQMKDPEFWIAQIGDMTYRGRPLSEVKQIPGIFQTFTAAQLRDAVKKCVADDRAVRLEAISADINSPAPIPASVGDAHSTAVGSHAP